MPLIVIHYDGTWQMEYGRAMLSTLAKQPPAFVRRVVLCSIESAMQLEPFAHLFRDPLASPTFVTLPFSILTEGEKLGVSHDHWDIVAERNGVEHADLLAELRFKDDADGGR